MNEKLDKVKTRILELGCEPVSFIRYVEKKRNTKWMNENLDQVKTRNSSIGLSTCIIH
jgi:hypothetical protein